MCGWEPLACDGVRPDNPDAKLDSLRDATDEKRASERFRLGKALPCHGHGIRIVPRRHQLCDDVRELERRPGRSSAFPAKPVRPVGAYRRR